jgi:hypothetical protein
VEGIEKEIGTIRIPKASRSLQENVEGLLAGLQKAEMTD